MIWQPQYTISNKLLLIIREIGESIGEIRAQHITHTALAKLELNARELSPYTSTSIEGNPLPLTDVKQLLKSRKETIRDTEREVLNYNKALQTLYKSVRNNRFKLTAKTLEKVQVQVVGGLMDNPAHCGALRQEPVILAGIFHRQNVIVHPFIDGNDRTTRLLTTAILGNAGLDLFEIFSFEDYYNRNITRYFKAVGLEGDYYDLKDNIDFSTWLEYFSEGILDELRRIIKLLPQQSSTKPRIETHHQQILDYILERGNITQREYRAISDRSLASRKLDFEKLTQLNLIRTKGVGRGTYYILASSK